MNDSADSASSKIHSPPMRDSGGEELDEGLAVALKVMPSADADLVQIAEVAVHRLRSQERAFSAADAADKLQVFAQHRFCALRLVKRVLGAPFDAKAERFGDGFHDGGLTGSVLADEYRQGAKVEAFVENVAHRGNGGGPGVSRQRSHAMFFDPSQRKGGERVAHLPTTTRPV